MASEKMISVNKDRLLYARKYYNLSIEETASKTKIKPEKLEAFEAGLKYPSYAELNKLAEYYHQSLIFFFFPDSPKDAGLLTKFRGVVNESIAGSTKRIKEMIELANIYRLNLSELYAHEEYPRFSDTINTEKVSKRSLSEWLRGKLSLPISDQIQRFNRPEILLEEIRNKLYALGVYVFKASFQDNSVSGLCLYDDEFPIILINNKTAFTRQLFTVFHELFHIFLKQVDIDYLNSSKEKECDTFASSFLIPDDDFRNFIAKYSFFEDEELISTLSHRYCVSRDAIRYRLLKLDKISIEYYRAHHEEEIRNYSSGDAGGNYYYTKISYLGQSYLKTVCERYYSGSISIAKVGIYTQMKASNVSSLLSTVFRG